MFNGLTCPGDEYIVFAPYFPEYKVFIEGSGAKMVLIPPEIESFQIDFDAFEGAVSPNTKGVVINTPNNPSGVVYSAHRGGTGTLRRSSTRWCPGRCGGPRGPQSRRRRSPGRARRRATTWWSRAGPSTSSPGAWSPTTSPSASGPKSWTCSSSPAPAFVSSAQIGELVMERLKKVDEVAYVRFASVYRQFKDINTFMTELNKLLEDK